jgi:excisionase family DNA binding protein
MTPRMADYLTLAEAAKIAGLDAATLRWQIKNDRLVARKIGRDWFVTRGELDAYLAQRWKRKRKREE